jgi:hypothetical protein
VALREYSSGVLPIISFGFGSVYSFAMADNTKQLAEEFTAMILDSIKLEESSPTRPRNPTLVAFQVKMPIQLRNRIRKAVAAKGIEQTQLCNHVMHQLVSVILQDQEPGLRRGGLLNE